MKKTVDEIRQRIAELQAVLYDPTATQEARAAARQEHDELAVGLPFAIAANNFPAVTPGEVENDAEPPA